MIIISVVAFSFITSVFNDSRGSVQGDPVIVNIAMDSGADDIAAVLAKNGLISYPFIFKVYSMRANQFKDFKYGLHTFNKGMSYEELAEELKRTVSPDGISVTIPEGKEFREIADILAGQGLINKDKFYEAANNYDFDYDFIRAIPARENRLEGYLFPATYLFTQQDDEVSIINKMLSAFDLNFISAYRKQTQEMGMSIDQVVTLASIIEREAANTDEMKIVSSVFHNRLDSTEYPYLQSCATVQYILKERKAVLSDEDTQIDSPYNTYINKGLPIGPIASPGTAAINAALNPAKTDYYFFVLGPDGKHIFSKTYEEHLTHVQ